MTTTSRPSGRLTAIIWRIALASHPLLVDLAPARLKAGLEHGRTIPLPAVAPALDQHVGERVGCYQRPLCGDNCAWQKREATVGILVSSPEADMG